MSDCKECGKDIIEENRKVVEDWSEEKQALHFWYWCGVTDFGELPISPYSTEIIHKFDKKCDLE